MGKHNGTGVVKTSTVTVKQVDAAFSFPVDYEFQDSCVGAGADECPDGLALELEADGFARGCAVEQRPAQVSFSFSARKVFPFGFGKFPSFSEGGFCGGKESSVKVTVLVNWLSGKLFVLGLLGHLAGPCFVEHLGVHIGAKAVSRFLGMGTPEFLPGEGTLLNLVGEFAGEVNSGDPVFFEHALMGGHGQRSLFLFELLEHALVDEMSHDDIGLGAFLSNLTDDSLHPANACFLGMPGILVVVDRELDEEQIDGTVLKDVPA